MNMYAVIFLFTWILPSTAGDELLLVQVVWRAGNHIPTRVCKNDNNTWNEPWGQLTMKGMSQQKALGSLLHSRYAANYKLLNNTYHPKEVYFRSTDFNRTITSATANAIGMYFNRSGDVAGLDYPQNADWPNGYVPVPVHMIEAPIDHLANPDADCARHEYLLELVRNSTEYQNFLNTHKAVLDSVKAKCGDDNFDALESLYIAESYRIEQLAGLTPIINADESQILRQAAAFKNARGVSNVSGVNLQEELRKARAGTLLWDVINHMKQKVFCADAANFGKSECEWMNSLKYFAYSVTDATIDALLAALESTDPAESSFDAFAIIFELWQTANGTQFTVLRTDENITQVLEMTGSVAGCANGYCSLDEFSTYSARYNPGNATTFCANVPTGWAPRKRKIEQQQSDRHLSNGAEVEKAKNTAGDELVFLQIIWRHGDRYPKEICKNDNNTEDTWRTGYGELSELGMRQHQLLGSLIYDAYANNITFLSKEYVPDEIYIRSTDINRTVISAMANMIGLYYNKGNQSGAFPVEDGWPASFVPVAIHNVADETDYIGDPHAVCLRKNDLVEIVLQTPEIVQTVEENKEFFENMSKICGQELGLLDLSMPVDTQEVEKTYNRSLLFTEEDYLRMKRISIIGDYVYNGILNTSNYGGYDLRRELTRISGGSILYDLIDHMDLKIHCLNTTNVGNSECVWMQKLKYYAYSARGSTMLALLSALEATKVSPNGEPRFAGALIFELWRRSSGQFEVKIKFRGDPDGEVFQDITSNVSGCPVSGGCPLETFKQRSNPFNPGKIEDLCNMRITANISSTSPTVAPPTTTSSSTVSPRTATSLPSISSLTTTPNSNSASALAQGFAYFAFIALLLYGSECTML